MFGLLFCVIVMLIWLNRSGMEMWLAGVFLLVAFAIFYALSRVVAEGGMATVVAPNIAAGSCVSAFGAGAVGAAGLLSLGLGHPLVTSSQQPKPPDHLVYYHLLLFYL